MHAGVEVRFAQCDRKSEMESIKMAGRTEELEAAQGSLLSGLRSRCTIS